MTSVPLRPMIALAAVGGAVDASTWLAVKVFGGNMTGDAVLGAAGLAGAAAPAAAMPYALVLGAFLVGVSIAALLDVRAKTAAQGKAAAQNALWLETFAFVGLALALVQHPSTVHDETIAAVAGIALGLQGGAVRAAFGRRGSRSRPGAAAMFGSALASPAGIAAVSSGPGSVVLWVAYVATAVGVALLVAHVPAARATVPIACAIAIAFVGIALDAGDDTSP